MVVHSTGFLSPFSQPSNLFATENESDKDLVKVLVKTANSEHLQSRRTRVILENDSVGSSPLEHRSLIAVGELILILTGPCKC